MLEERFHPIVRDIAAATHAAWSRTITPDEFRAAMRKAREDCGDDPDVFNVVKAHGVSMASNGQA